MTCGIYMIQNKVNNKMYIGQAVDIEKRWRDHRCGLRNRNHGNTHLQRSWTRDGEANFEFGILLECEESQLNMYEEYYIFELMTYDDRVGYNKTYGGGGCKATEETRRKLSESRKGKNCGKNHPFYGKQLSEETRRKLSDSRKKPVLQIDPTTNKLINIYPSSKEAERQGFHTGSISKCCRGKRKTHKGYKWMFLSDYEKLSEQN